MKVNGIVLNNYKSQNKNTQALNTARPVLIKHDIKPFSYPKNYYLNFTGSRMITLEEQLERVDTSLLPKRIQDKIKEELQNGATKNLYEIHKETYAPLLECSTLDEVKAKFPEFQDVIDAKDLDESQMFTTLKKIKNGKIEGLKIEDLSLELLKSHYGRGLSPSHYREAYFNLSKDTVFSMLKTLGIERLNGQYLFLINSSSPERRAKNSAAWTEEKRVVCSLRETEKWADENKRKAMSEKQKQYHIDHPEVARAHSERMKGRVETPEHRAKISKGVKKFREEHPEVTEAQRQAWKEHADITRRMSEIAKSRFPYLRTVFYKRQNDIPLTQCDIDYERYYYGVCEKEIPGFRAKVAETYKRLLRELSEEDGNKG